MKLIFRDKYSKLVDLKDAKSIRVFLPYRDSRSLELRGVKSSDLGMAEVTIGSFERKGLNDGEGQSFKAEVHFAHKKLDFLFDKELTVITDDDGVKQLCYETGTTTSR